MVVPHSSPVNRVPGHLLFPDIESHLFSTTLTLVTLGGAILFLAFGFIYAYEGLFLED